MKRTLLFVFCSIFVLALAAKTVTPAASLPTYYKDIDGKSGKSLFDAVQKVTKEGYTSLGYDGLWGAFKTTDKKSNGTKRRMPAPTKPTPATRILPA